MSETSNVDLRSYYPKFERKLTWIDGVEYSIREIDDLSEVELASMMDEEGRFGSMGHPERLNAHRRHLQMMLVRQLEVRASAAAGERSLRLEGDTDLREGDVIFLTDGLYVERNTVQEVGSDAVAVADPWLFGAPGISGRLYRAIRMDALSHPGISQKQFMVAVSAVKQPPKDGSERPQKAANESTS